MPSQKKYLNGYLFLIAQLALSFLYAFILVYFSLSGDWGLEDELLVCLIVPIYYAAFHYTDSRLYLLSLLIAMSASVWAFSQMELNFWNSLYTTLIVCFSVALSGEWIFRMQRQRSLIVAALHENQARLNAIIEGAADAISTQDRNGKIVMANEAYARMAGRSRLEILGKTVFDLYDPARALKIHKTIQQVWNGETVQMEETIPAGNENRIYTVTEVPLYNDKDVIFEICTIARDITRIREEEKAKEQLIAELRESAQNIRQLSGLLPICSSCKKIRDTHGAWKQVEIYLREHTHAEFTHGLCPDCTSKYFGDFSDAI